MIETAVTTPLLLNRFDEFNDRKAYANWIKPFNFLLSASVDPIDCPPQTANANGFRLVAPYSPNSADWLRFTWIDLHSGKEYRIKTEGQSNRGAIRVQTFADVLRRFREHPEAKSADSDGKPAGKQTKGLLGRRQVRVFTIRLIGKETNLLEQQEEGGLTADPQAVYSYEMELELLRAHFGEVSIRELADRSGVSQRMLRDVRAGRRRLSTGKLGAVIEALAELLDG